ADPYSRDVSDADKEKLVRIQAVFTALLQHQLSRSLERVEESLGRWRRGELGAFEAHAEVLKHAARAERIAGRIAQAGNEGIRAEQVLRDALAAGLVERDEFIALAGAAPEDVTPSSKDEEGLGLPRKQDFALELLEHGPVLLHVDARAADVAVPAHLKHDP